MDEALPRRGWWPRRLHHQLALMVSLALVAALAVTVCGLVLAWVLKGPVQALNRARLFATQITQSDGRQLAIEPGPIEVMELSKALNEASLRMQQQMLIIEDWLSQHRDSSAVSGVLYLSDVTRQHTLDQMKSEFLSMAAHELRTPMVSIFGFTELMLNREMTPERRKDLLGSIHRHCQSMVSILNELLDLARIESRRGQDFQFEQVAMADVVQSVRADTHKLQQAVLNILSNAYKYSPDGGEVAVGLSAEDQARLGERFFRVDKSGNIPGTGLGVSIVKELMELMGGRMQVSSALGQGTTVTLWL